MAQMLRALERLLVENDLTSTLLFNRVTGAMGAYVEAARRRGKYARYRRVYDIHPDFEFLGPGTYLYGPGDIVLGKDSYIGRYSRIQAESGLTVRVGENTAISYYVHIFTQNRVADQDMSRTRNRTELLTKSRGDVTIGDHCWIGAMTFITEDTEIGDNAVVGANSVVTEDLPSYGIAAGAPARVKRFKTSADREQVAEVAPQYRNALDDSLVDDLEKRAIL